MTPQLETIAAYAGLAFIICLAVYLLCKGLQNARRNKDIIDRTEDQIYSEPYKMPKK